MNSRISLTLLEPRMKASSSRGFIPGPPHRAHRLYEEMTSLSGIKSQAFLVRNPESQNRSRSASASSDRRMEGPRRCTCTVLLAPVDPPEEMPLWRNPTSLRIGAFYLFFQIIYCRARGEDIQGSERGAHLEGQQRSSFSSSSPMCSMNIFSEGKRRRGRMRPGRLGNQRKGTWSSPVSVSSIVNFPQLCSSGDSRESCDPRSCPTTSVSQSLSSTNSATSSSHSTSKLWASSL